LVVRCPQCKKILAFEGEDLPEECPGCGREIDSSMMPGSEVTTVDDTQPVEHVRARDSDSGRGSGRPSHFGGYQILEEMGRGAMGIVYKARQPTLERIVALKVLLAGEHASEHQIGRFMREAQAIARVRHPNIVPIHDVGIFEGKHYFTMDFVEGKRLEEIIAGGGLPPAEALEVIEKAADAVAEAHRAGVIHRDIKPSNIMIDQRGEVKIMDFGLAKRMDSGTKYTRSGTTIGTPSYMPPEQARGELENIDGRSDVYALGAVAYELFTGSPPFDGASMLDIIMSVLNEDPLPPRHLNPKIHRDIQTIIMKCLEKSPARRYESAVELRDDLRRYKSGEAIRARPARLARRIARRFARRRMEFAFIAALAVIASASIYIVNELSMRVQELESSQSSTSVPTAPTWGEVFTDPDPFADGSRTKHWHERKGYIDFVDGKMTPVLAGVELLSQELWYAHVELAVTAEVASSALNPAISVGLVGSDGAPIYITYGKGKMVLLGLEDLDGSFARRRSLKDLAPLAERDAPPLEAGRSYTITLREKDMAVEFAIEGEGLSETLAYKNVHFSNWRMKNLRISLRTTPAEVTFKRASLRQLFPGQLDAIGAADDRFFRGDYNGAQAAYRAIIESGSPAAAKVLAACHRLGLYHEIKGEYVEAAGFYDRAGNLLAERTGPLSQTEQRMLTEARLHGVFCLNALGRRPEAIDRLSDLVGASGPVTEPWSWHFPALLESLAAAGDLDGAITAASAVDLPPGFGRMESSVRALARALVAADRPLDLTGLSSLYPGEYLAGEVAAAIMRLIEKKNIQGALSMISMAAGEFPSRINVVRTSAEPLAAALTSMKRYSELIEVHRLLGGAVFAKEIEKAAAAAAAEHEVDGAVELLEYASEQMKPADALKSAASALAESLLASGDYARVLEVQKAYSQADLTSQLVVAAEALKSSGDFAECLRLLEFSRIRTEGKNAELAAIAAEVGSQFAQVDAERRFWRVLAAYNAYPGPGHLRNFQALIEGLTAAGSAEDALSVFVFARGNMPDEAAGLEGLAMQCLEEILLPERREAALTLVESVSQKLATDPVRLAVWKVTLGDFYLRFGRQQKARSLYEEASRAENAGAAAALGSFRLAIIAEIDGRAAKAAAVWLNLLESKVAEEKMLNVARFMLGRTGEATLSEPEKKGAICRLNAPAVQLLKALRIAGTGDAEQLQRHELVDSARRASAKTKFWPYHLFAAGLFGAAD